MRRFWKGIAGTALALAGSPAFADVAGRYETTEKDAFFDMEMTIEADGNGNVRLQMAQLPAYYLLLGDEFYLVGRDASGPSVVRLADVMTISQETTKRMGVDEAAFKDAPYVAPPTFAAMGEEQVGEWTGTAYGIVPEGGDEPSRAIFVISDDPRLAPLGQALVGSQKAIGSGMSGLGRLTMVLGEMSASLIALLEQGAPIRMSELQLTGYSLDPIDPQRFALPAEPLTLDQLRAQQEPFPPPPTLAADRE